MSTGLIFDIKKYAINDGPGIRLTVFFKGCNLACQWCHNPESISVKRQKMYNATKCIGSTKCLDVCPNDALMLTENGIVTDVNACNLCGKCAEVCPTKAFEMLGEFKPLDNLMKIIDNEAVFFDQSGGGVTFSGGEPLLHASYLIAALKECGKRYYHRVVDTTAFSSLETIVEVADNTELFLIDLKIMDNASHKKHTGVSNKKIHRNIIEIAKKEVDIIFRMPVIFGVNTADENTIATAEFMNSLEGNRDVINLLPYHSIAENKYKKLGDLGGFTSFEEPTDLQLSNMISVFNKYGIKASVGG